ncbi:MAG: hypothetical protein JW800_03420 [Candidatus Omnitrophica bacterium]|nr:hypothetical protein [Candidatus Omnitrophota bacterium]
MKLKNYFVNTGIGSLPHKDEKKACETVFREFQRIPFWPQLVNRSFLEDMIVQFSERMPGIELDSEQKKLFVKRGPNIRKDIEELEERYSSDDLEYFSISEDYAAGFYEYLFRLKEYDLSEVDYLKGQITGPISFTFGVSDKGGIPLFFDKELREAAVKTLTLRARWQAARLKRIFRDIIIFIDEPSLVFFKHSGDNSKIKKEELRAYINRVAEAIHTEGCFAGLHCCADCDWDFVLSTDVDIVNFDAYSYGAGFVKSHLSISSFLERDGILAWGMVPTTPDLTTENVDRLIIKLEEYIDQLAAKGIGKELITRSSLITPSCGCGALDVKGAETVLGNCMKLSQYAQERFL